MAVKTRIQGTKKRHIRIRKKVYGTIERPRVVVTRSLNNITAQIVNDNEGKTIVSYSTLQGKDLKGTKSEKAKAVGIELAARAKKAKVKKVVFDRSGYKYFGRVASLADGLREGGLEF
jgi:large subunit ribosomal protein L18